jgi:hypothetical protein
MLFFDDFPSRDAAERFLAAVQRRFPHFGVRLWDGEGADQWPSLKGRVSVNVARSEISDQMIRYPVIELVEGAPMGLPDLRIQLPKLACGHVQKCIPSGRRPYAIGDTEVCIECEAAEENKLTAMVAEFGGRFTGT